MLRAGAANALRMCASRMQGCEHILEAQALPVLLQTATDANEAVRSVLWSNKAEFCDSVIASAKPALAI